MAFMNCRFRSAELKKEVEVNVVYPISGGTPKQVLYLLHGIAGDASCWMRRTSIERYALARKIAVIMPDGACSFYTDAVHGAARYWSYISEELPELAGTIFKLPKGRDQTFVAGLSMGGYGALKLGLRLGERFAAVGALSAATDIRRRFRSENPERRALIKQIFGTASRLAADGNVLFVLAKDAVASGKKLPKIISFCGTEDPIIAENRRFGALLERLKYPDFHFYERPGVHNWDFWDAYIPEVLDFLISGKLPE
ncbi:MAG: hypothetical protein IJJ28_02965 [Lentisphaeria bacterium]|nr:hypothetical protein [Lentisphaeria bacterium]